MELFKNLFYLENKSTNATPFNLAFEEYAIRNLPAENSYLLFYVNEPSVVVGKHQNIAEEINQPYCYSNNIPVYRRISGGGTVYHDPGNLNFSFITAHNLKDFNNYEKFLKPVIKIFNQLGYPVQKDGHNNLMLMDKKISGNAQFTSRGRMMSHGTILFDSNMEHLRNTLKIDANLKIESRSSKSRRASVCNLNEYASVQKITIESFTSALKKELQLTSDETFRLQESDWYKIEDLANEKYLDWEWNYGRSPDSILRRKFTLNGRQSELEINIIKGQIVAVSDKKNVLDKEQIKLLLNEKYDYGVLSHKLNGNSAFNNYDKSFWLKLLFGE